MHTNDGETLLNNCRIQQFFGASTARAADAIVSVSGYGPREAVLDIDRDEILLNVGGDEPVVARKPNYRFDPPFQGLYGTNPFYTKAGSSSDDEEEEVRARPVFRRTTPPSRRQSLSPDASELIERASRMFHPVSRDKWQLLEGAERRSRLVQAGIMDDAVLADERFVVRRRRLPFFPHFDWYHIADTRETLGRHGFYLLGEKDCLPFFGDTRFIFHAIEQDNFCLQQRFIKDYLDFFIAHCAGPEGRFLIIDTADVHPLARSAGRELPHGAHEQYPSTALR